MVSGDSLAGHLEQISEQVAALEADNYRLSGENKALRDKVDLLERRLRAFESKRSEPARENSKRNRGRSSGFSGRRFAFQRHDHYSPSPASEGQGRQSKRRQY
ncbi:hypothetical protein BOTBODRAFT_53497 [Botryobasidium botryosum FD-172 SS1]|uniref:Uncharacterized protein n=1 Tax=Botryobasidium botryosum (strain FD-172 SS1) TaxID=930990 RepID=A0A067MPD4_BOTB1|nr:hypothetical protein BOTBODRAFT_53497 [Botryobasidium botryosum FD-172 SS1]